MLSIAKLLVVSTAFLLGLAAQAQTPYTGALLVARGMLTDPNFSESVVLLIRHNDNGTVGVIINRPTWVEPGQVSPELAEVHGDSGRVFFGGPVAPTRLVVLVSEPLPDDIEDLRVLDGVYVSSTADFLLDGEMNIGDESYLRMYAGHAAWAPGQLAAEIAEGAWNVVPGRSEHVFSREPLELWRDLDSPGSGLIAAVVPELR